MMRRKWLEWFLIGLGVVFVGCTGVFVYYIGTSDPSLPGPLVVAAVVQSTLSLYLAWIVLDAIGFGGS